MLLIQFVVLQIIVFAGVIYFLKKILYSDTQSAVNRLDHTYQELLGKQKELQQKIEQAEKEYKEKKDEAVQIAEKLKQEALEEIRKKEESTVKEAKAEADEMVKKARAACEKIRREIERDVQMKNLDYVSKLLNAAFNASLLETVHIQLINDFLGKEAELDFSNVSPELNVFTLKSPLAIPEAVKSKILALVKKKVGRAMECKEEEEKELIGGIALVFDTLVLDGSFANHIHDAVQREKRKIELEA